MQKISTALAVMLAVCSTANAGKRPDSHAPISVMGEHMHEKGELMFSYRYMHMSMEDNKDGSSSISPEEIVTTVPNRFAGSPGMPPTLRVVPTEMTMDMHMLGMMYAPTDWVTLMGMVNYQKKDMTHITFAGPAGTNRLGKFKASTSGIGDSTLAAMFALSDLHATHRWHATLGVSLPTGSVDETDRILTPMNTQPTVRLPYPMQLGSGTYDLITGLTYASHADSWGWGSQLGGVTRLGDNDEGYTLGNEIHLEGWVSYLISSELSVSGRLGYFDRGNIDGIDSKIMAPVQTADPSRQGGERFEFGLGMNYLLPAKGHRLAFEANIPIEQDLDGPQLEVDWSVTVGWQYTP
jgi:hypothetical protein